MLKEEFIGTIVVNGNKIDIGIDDYGQEYFFEYLNDNNELETVGCGAYNTYYLEEICYYFDPKGTTISLYGKEQWDTDIAIYESRLEPDSPYYEDMLKHLEHMKNDDYSLYDFDAMYQDIASQLKERN